jgi:nucleoside-triphosphatase THEP1
MKDIKVTVTGPVGSGKEEILAICEFALRQNALLVERVKEPRYRTEEHCIIV